MPLPGHRGPRWAPRPAPPPHSRVSSSSGTKSSVGSCVTESHGACGWLALACPHAPRDSGSVCLRALLGGCATPSEILSSEDALLFLWKLPPHWLRPVECDWALGPALVPGLMSEVGSEFCFIPLLLLVLTRGSLSCWFVESVEGPGEPGIEPAAEVHALDPIGTRTLQSEG